MPSSTVYFLYYKLFIKAKIWCEKSFTGSREKLCVSMIVNWFLPEPANFS